jgi:DNA-binding PadR family transcriptional regulator
MITVAHDKLPEAALFILSSLGEGPKHGYAIRKDIARRAGNDMQPRVTTLYRLLRQLLDAKLVEEIDDRPAPELDDERRRYYRITAAGRRALAVEVRRLERLLDAVGHPTATRRARA